MSEQLAVAIISVVGAVLVALVERGRRAANHAAGAADRAAEYAAPTGNGFARRTEATLGRIEADIGGMRSEIRDLRRADDRLHQRIDRLHPRKDTARDE